MIFTLALPAPPMRGMLQCSSSLNRWQSAVPSHCEPRDYCEQLRREILDSEFTPGCLLQRPVLVPTSNTLSMHDQLIKECVRAVASSICPTGLGGAASCRRFLAIALSAIPGKPVCDFRQLRGMPQRIVISPLHRTLDSDRRRLAGVAGWLFVTVAGPADNRGQMHNP